MALTGNLSFRPIATQTSQLDLVTGSGLTPTGTASSFAGIDVTNGVGANQATNYVSDTRTLAAGASETLDLNGGLVDAFGTVVLFTRVIFLMIKCPITNIAPIIFDTSGVAGIGVDIGVYLFKVPPGGCLVLGSRTAAAIVTAAGVSDLITMRNNSFINSGTYDIIVVGS